jgi:hypothetical protein
MKTAPVDFDAEQLFQAHIAELDSRPEVIQHRELARLVRRFEYYRLESERIREAISELSVESAMFIEEADTLRAFSGLNDELNSACIEPAPALLDEAIDSFGFEGAVVFLAEFELNGKSSLVSHAHDAVGLGSKIRKAFSALDASEADLGAEIEIGVKLALCYGNFERAASGYGRHAMRTCEGHFPAYGLLASDEPTGHGDLENRDEMRTLVEVAVKSGRVVTGVERTGKRREFGDSDFS